MMIIGLGFCFFGLKIYQPTLFLIGFLSGFGFNIVIMGEFVIHYDSERLMAIACIINAVIFGVLCGYMTLTNPKLGYFALGMWMGIILALLCNNAFLHKIKISNQFVVLWVAIIVLSVVMGLLGSFFYKHCVMVCTGFIGSYFLIRPLGWIIGEFPNELQITKELKYGTVTSVPNLFYLYFALILLIGAIGVKFQYGMYYSRRNQEQENDLQLYLADPDFVDLNKSLLDKDDEDLTTKERKIKDKLLRMQKNVEKEKKKQSRFLANADKLRRREKGEDVSSDEEDDDDDEENSDGDEEEGGRTNKIKKSKDFGLTSALSRSNSRKKSMSKMSKKQNSSGSNDYEVEKKGGKNGKAKYHDDDTPDSQDYVQEKSNKKFSQVVSGFKKANKKEEPEIEMDDLSESNAYDNDDRKKDQSQENSDQSDSDNEKNKKKNAKNAAKLAKQQSKKKK